MNTLMNNDVNSFTYKLNHRCLETDWAQDVGTSKYAPSLQSWLNTTLKAAGGGGGGSKTGIHVVRNCIKDTV